jgi:hypothetical protein
MRWLLHNRRFGSWLALAALALQLVLSFGHVHLDGVGSAGDGIAVTGAANAPEQRAPGQQPGGDGDEYCAICATIYLAANAFVPQAPQLPALFTSRLIEHFDSVAVDFTAPRRTLFQPRAPPLA